MDLPQFRDATVKQDDLVDYYPLPEYALCDMPIIVPHHSFLSNDDLGGGAGGNHS